MAVHTFEKSLANGKIGERLVNDYFRHWYKITSVPLETEKSDGIDYIYTSISTGNVFSVEIKTDARTTTTGNMFLEMAVYYNNGALLSDGWVVKSKADIVLYYAMPDTIYIIDQPKLRENCGVFEGEYSLVKVPNKKIYAMGYLVPPADLKPFITRKERVKISYE